MELAIINGTYRDNSNGQKQNGMSSSGARLTAVPLGTGSILQCGSNIAGGQFRLPTALGGVGGVATQVMTAPGMASMASVLRPVRLS